MLKYINRIMVFDIVVMEGFNDESKPIFNKYRVTTKTMAKFLFDHQNIDNSIVGVYPLEEVDEDEIIDNEMGEDLIGEQTDGFDGM